MLSSVSRPYVTLLDSNESICFVSCPRLSCAPPRQLTVSFGQLPLIIGILQLHLTRHNVLMIADGQQSVVCKTESSVMSTVVTSSLLMMYMI